MSGFHVRTSNGIKNNNAAYAVSVTQEFDGGEEDKILEVVFSSEDEREQLKNELLDLIGRIIRPRPDLATTL